MYSQTKTPKVYPITVYSGSTYGGPNLISFTQPVASLQINSLTNVAIRCKLNGDNGAIFTLQGDQSQSFHAKDVTITSIDFANAPSGSGNVNIEIIVGLGQ